LLTWFRGAMVASVVAFAWNTFALTRSRLVTFMVAIILSLLVCATFSVRTDGQANSMSIERSDAGHAKLASAAAHIAFAHLLTGVGVGDLAIRIPAGPRGAGDGLAITTDPKNVYLFYAAEMGLIGIGLLVIFGFAAREALLSDIAGSCPTGIGSVWIAVAVAGLFDCPFGPASHPVGNCLLGMLLGMSIAALPRAWRSAVQINTRINSKGHFNQLPPRDNICSGDDRS